MILVGWALALVVLAPQAPAPDPLARDALARARTAYNERRFDDAVAAATEAGKTPAFADAAAVVRARAYLERYHASDAEHRASYDLDHARDALRGVNSANLSSRDEIEFLVALGQSLFFDEPPQYAAAAEMFDAALSRGGTVSEEHGALFEWWAEALDREAQFVPEADRKPLYTRILTRAEAELARDHTSTEAIYWLAAASRGAEDLERAFGAAVAGWVRAGSLGARGLALRADLDRLVTSVILPERARELASNGDALAELSLLKTQWEELKKKWERQNLSPDS